MYGLGNITVTISNTLMPNFQGLRSNGLGFVPMKSPSGNAFELEYVPISKIQTDEKNFQNRADKYSEKSVNAILKAVKNGTFNWFAFDPVLLWKNPSGDLIVLSGHSRTEAFRRLAAERPKIEIDGLSFDKIPAKIFKGDFVNAKNLALNSNALSTTETLLERADFYRNQRELLNNKSDIAKLREKAVRENQGSVIWDLSFLPADGLTVDSLKRFKMQEDSEAAFENYVRAVNIAQWIGKAFQIYKGLSRLHDSELFKFLLNNYGTKSGQYNSFAKLNERLQVLYPRNVKNAEKTDLDGNYTTPFGLVIYEKNDDEINEIQELESEAKKAKRELDKKIKDLRGRAADKAQIFEIVTPHFNEYVNKLFDWWNSLDREKVRKTDKNQGALFGCLSQMIDDYSVNDNDVLCAGLGKPTVKFEFEDNADLFNFFKSKKSNFENAQNVDFKDITQSPTTSKSKRTNLRQTAITTPETLYLPYSEGAKALPGSSSPKALPPTSQNIPPLSSVLKPDGVYINHRKIGDYGYINSRLKYINLFIDREYMVNDNIFKWCEKIFPHAVIIVCFQDDNKNWKFFFQRPKYKDFIYKHFSNSFIQNAGIKYFRFDLPHIEKVIQAFESEGFPVVLVYRNIVEDINDLSTQTSPKALPPATSTHEPTTPKATSPDWGGFSKRFENASGWSSFDPERSARVNTGAEIIENRELDRVQIKFSGIPSEDCRTDLKRNGFRWSPFYKVWQRKLTPQAVRVANEIVAKYYSVGLGKPTIKLEFEDNGEIFKTFGNLQGLTVNDKPAWIFNCPESMLKTNGFKPTYKRLLSYDAFIDSSDGNKTLVGYGFNKSTLDELKEACKSYKQVEKLAAHLKADSEAQSAFNVWHWLHCNVNYNYDKAGEEEIRTPARTWADRKTGVDCDCLAVFTACLFICMGYRPLFEIVAFHNSPQYSHIYVNLNGLAVDRVLPVFGIRPSLITKKYLMEIPVYHLSGIDGCMNGLQGVYESTLSKIFSKTATPEDSLNFRKAQVLITLQNVDPDAYKLGAIIMPHVQAIGDDGAYYFDNEYVAKVAKQLDSDLQKRHLNGIYGLGKGWLKKAIKKVGNAVKKVAKSTANAVKTVAKATANTVKAAAKSTVNAVKATANVTKAAAQAVTGNAKKTKETLKKAATQVKAAAIAPIKQAAKDTKSVVKNAVVQPVKTVTQVTLINPIKDTVKIAGKLFKVLLVKLNPALILIRSGLKVLIAINFLGMATRFSIGLLTQAEAEQKGYDKDTWESAKKALDKIVRFWKKIGGKEDKLLKTIRNGSTRKALFKKNYNKNTKIVETGEDSATLGAVEIKILNGINGLGEGFTIGTALAAVGAFFAKIWGWIKKIVPKVGQVVKKIASSNAVQTAAQFIKGQTGKSSDTPDNSLDNNITTDTKPNWMPWAFAAAALGVGIFAFSGKKKKKRA